MTTQQPVLAAIDFSDASDEALRQAHAEALRRHTGLVVCHVLPESFRVRVLFPHEAGVDLPAQAALEGQARDVMRARVDDILGPTAVPVTLEVDAGSPHAGILDVADRVLAGLVVTGPGPTAARVARASHFPVLIARPSPARGPVLGATDFSTAALPALNAAAELAAAAADPLIVMHCLDVEPTAAMVATSAGGMVPMPFMPEVMLQEMTAQATERLEEALASFGVPGRVLVLLAPAGRGIVDAASAERATRVVVGTHGRAGFARLLMGSVADYVASHAPCSVLVVPLTPEPAAETEAVPAVAVPLSLDAAVPT